MKSFKELVAENKRYTERVQFEVPAEYEEDASHFIGAASRAHKQGKKEFKLGDKTYPVTIKKPVTEEKYVVQFYDNDGTASKGKMSEFGTKEAAKAYIDRAKKVLKPGQGSYKMHTIQSEGYQDDLKRKIGRASDEPNTKNNYKVKIDGRDWQVFGSKQTADKAAATLRSKGKKADVFATKEDVGPVKKKKESLPFTPDPKKKPVKNSDGTTQSPMSRARALAKQGMNNMKEETLDEAMGARTKERFQAAERDLAQYAQKSGGMDKRDFMDIAKMLGQIGRVNILQSGQILSTLNRKLSNMDTDPRDKVYSIVKKHGLMESVEAEDLLAESKTPDARRMAMSQLRFIKYAADEIAEWMSDGGEMEEWYQNKLAAVHDRMKGLHAYAEGDSDEMDDDDDDVDEELNEAREDTPRKVARLILGMGVRQSAPESEILKKIPFALKKLGLQNDRLIKRSKDFQGEVIDIFRSMKEEVYESYMSESHFKVGEKVECKASGMKGKIVKVDPEEKGKYYTAKMENGKMMKYAPDELKSLQSESYHKKKMDEKAVSPEQQRIMALALKYKRGELPVAKAGEQVIKLADSMSEKDLEKFAKTKHSEMPKESRDISFSDYLSEEPKKIDYLTLMNRVKELQSHGHRIEKKDVNVGKDMMIQYVDKDGIRRKLTLTQKGQSYQNLGPVSGHDDESSPQDKPTKQEPEKKRGRGRPAGSKSGARV